MKAYVCRAFGPVEYQNAEELADPRAAAGPVVDAVRAAVVSIQGV